MKQINTKPCIFADILDDSLMDVTGDEVSYEFNLAAFKLKRIVKREKRKD